MDHETYIQEVRRLALDYLRQSDPDAADRAARGKLCYGAGNTSRRGVTFYSCWQNGHGPDDPEPLIEICAFGESDPVQVAGTTIHELGHVLAGHGAGHGKAWRDACRALGLRAVRAAGTAYTLAMFAPAIRAPIARLAASLTDGRPSVPNGARIARPRNGGCTAGIGTRGGRSRGPGSGSRLRKYQCAHGQIVRAATDALDATCNVCSSPFARCA